MAHPSRPFGVSGAASRDALRPRRRVVVSGLTLLAVLAPGLTLPAGAVTGTGDPTVSSQAQVAAGRLDVAQRADLLGRLEARLAAAEARQNRLAVEAAFAVEAFDGARVRLDDATARAAAAALAARQAQARVAASRAELGRFAAAAYRGSGGLGAITAVFDAGGLRDLISRASALRAIGDRRERALQRIRAARAYARVLDRRAGALVVARRRAAMRVGTAQDVAAASVAAQTEETASLRAERTGLLSQLAAARHTSVRLEQRRQDGLARQRAAQQRREARQAAAEAARAAAAAQAAADVAAAEQARRDAAELARVADAKAADQRARNAATSAPAAPPAPTTSAAPKAPAPSLNESPSPRPTPEPRTQTPSPSPTSTPAPTPSPTPTPAPTPSPPPSPGGVSQGTSAGAEAAIAYAQAQLGKPYRWGAAGPDTFDCSGLTMRAWQQGGVGMEHYSVAQYAQAEKIPLSELRRGDLVFFASGADYRSIFHVALYLGNGQMIEAPYTGEDVRISSIWRSSLFGAARP